jgi:CRP-like cAMP-binding protein
MNDHLPFSDCGNCGWRSRRICPVGVDAAEGVRLLPCCRRKVARGEPVLPSRTSTGAGFGIVIAGLAREDRVSASATPQMLGLVLPGETVGDLPTRLPGRVLTALSDMQICHFRLSESDRLTEYHPEFRRRLLGGFSNRLDRLQTILWMRASLDTTCRVAGLLLLATHFLPTRREPNGVLRLSFHLPRRDAADLIGTTVESISRATHALARRGVIAIRDAETFDLLDTGALAEMSALDETALAALFPPSPETALPDAAPYRQHATHRRVLRIGAQAPAPAPASPARPSARPVQSSQR